jgi:hypothetical protein
MRGRTIGLLLVVAASSASLYRYGAVRAATTVTSNTAEACSKVANKLECNSDAAMIQDSYTACTKACPAKDQWYGYCSSVREKADDDCELLNVDGKSADKVKACKNQNAKREAECKASYRDKAQCTTDCATTRQQNTNDFIKRWTPVKK